MSALPDVAGEYPPYRCCSTWFLGSGGRGASLPTGDDARAGAVSGLPPKMCSFLMCGAVAGGGAGAGAGGGAASFGARLRIELAALEKFVFGGGASGFGGGTAGHAGSAYDGAVFGFGGDGAAAGSSRRACLRCSASSSTEEAPRLAPLSYAGGSTFGCGSRLSMTGNTFGYRILASPFW